MQIRKSGESTGYREISPTEKSWPSSKTTAVHQQILHIYNFVFYADLRILYVLYLFNLEIGWWKGTLRNDKSTFAANRVIGILYAACNS